LTMPEVTFMLARLLVPPVLKLSRAAVSVDNT